MTLRSSILLLVPAALQVWLTVILVQKRLHGAFRFFFGYTVFAIAASLLQFSVHRNYRIYFVSYWISELVYALLSMLAMFELFPLVFKAFTWIWQFWLAVWIVIAVMVVISVLHAIFVPAVQAGPLISAIASLLIGVRYVEAGILLAFILLAEFFRTRPRRYALGVLFGFGVVVLGNLVAGMLRSEFGTRFKFLFTFMPPVVYVIAVVIWLLTFIKREPPDPFERVRSPLRPAEVIEKVRRLTRGIKGQQ